MYKQIKWAIIGLGNPGIEYSFNRHNIGWLIAQALIDKYYKDKIKKHRSYLYAIFDLKDLPLIVAMPRTYMNKSGVAVSKIKEKYNLSSQNIIVISDEYNFELGRLHLRFNGGNGGHNGLASIEDWLRTSDFYRLRCGIGNNFSDGELVNYVLSDFNQNEKALVDDMIKRAVEAIEYIMNFGIARAMSDINSGALWKN